MKSTRITSEELTANLQSDQIREIKKEDVRERGRKNKWSKEVTAERAELTGKRMRMEQSTKDEGESNKKSNQIYKNKRSNDPEEEMVQTQRQK